MMWCVAGAAVIAAPELTYKSASKHVVLLAYSSEALYTTKPSPHWRSATFESLNGIKASRNFHEYQRTACGQSMFPKCQEDWKEIADLFEARWNFPHCLGAIDGKHIDIIPPAGSGSEFFNYKGRHSMVLLGIANINLF
ncbi:unnamed protein product [Acanthoscelides obtectus]|uniref:DDE Tnp4 domain-containing protein n=1 Tax=Acanthoscelides obtectus TaxID=200917 RepID=A0A9P0KAH9_ACAOB|nr:unnamed protein product [Acanthoscelides obtectus]CAK1662330.1 hypothetical protein AOBTE_LOCUS23082 [Acanthoscelides obtectus]